MATLSITWYNIEDARTEEFTNPSNPRLNAIAEGCLLNGQAPDFLCVGEIACDRPKVPCAMYNGDKENLALLMQRVLGLATQKTKPKYDCQSAFIPGNCGEKAIPIKGTKDYYAVREQPAWMKDEHGDLLNCKATFPGQYGVGSATHLPIKSVSVISQLEWRSYDSSVDFAPYRLSDGTPIPDSITLFDKGLIITQLEAPTPTYVIVTHLIPAYGFGNDKSPNIARNAAQMSFLSDLLLNKLPDGLRDDNGQEIPGISKEAIVIAMGDLNVDVATDKPGAKTLSALFQGDSAPFKCFPEQGPTEGSNNGKMWLDYMLYRGVTLDKGELGPLSQDRPSDHVPLRARFTLPAGSKGWCVLC